MLEEGHVAISDNGWTDNELGLEWLKQCFELETRRTTNGYRLLLMDGHASHITTEAIRFCIASKIVVLCLPLHTTHLLQPLDVGPFRPLAMAYRTGILERGSLNPVYSVDKLEVYKIARLRGISKENIEKGWRNAGLEPFDPKLVLDLLPKAQQESASNSIENPIEQPTSSTPIRQSTSISQPFQLPKTPGNVYDLEALFNRVFEKNPSLDLAIVDELKKAQKGACKALADSQTQRVTNDRLLEVAKEQKRRGARKRAEDCSSGRVIGIEAIEKREQKARDSAFLKAWREDFAIIDPKVFIELKVKSRKRKRKAIDAEAEAEAEAEATIPLLDPRLFEEHIRSPTKKGGEKASKAKATKPRKKAKALQETIEIDAESWSESEEVKTRAGRVVKRTSKVQKRV
jgi:septum formation inhibitor MinC